MKLQTLLKKNSADPRRWRELHLLSVLLTLLLALFLVYLLLILPALRAPAVTPPPSLEEGEGTLYRQILLYDRIDREQMMTITVHNKTGEYTFVRYTEEEHKAAAAAGLSLQTFAITVKNGDKFIAYPHIEYRETTLSELVVATGTPYVSERIAGVGSDEAALAAYGLSAADDPAWFEVVATDGTRHRVYVGNQTVTGGSYYLRLEGRDTVYVSRSAAIGSAVLAGVHDYVAPQLTYAGTVAQYLTSDNTLLSRVEAAGTVLQKYDIATLTYYVSYYNDNGEPVTEDTVTDYAPSILRELLVGKSIGCAPFELTVTHEKKGETDENPYAGKTVTYHIRAIPSLLQTQVLFHHRNLSECDVFDPHDIYYFEAPSALAAFIPNSSHIQDLLYLLGEGGLAGNDYESLAKTVGIGLSDANMEKFGLEANMFYYRVPLAVKDTSTGSTPHYEVTAYQPITLYISERQEDGSYYVGSTLTDIIAAVDGSILSFLEQDTEWWLKPSVCTVNIDQLQSLDFRFSFRDEQSQITFAFTQAYNEDKKASYANGIYYVQGAKALDLEAYRELHRNLVELRWTEGYDGTRPIGELLADPSACVLTLTVKTTTGRTRIYRFYPYSERHVLVSAEDGGGSEGAFFYITASELEKFYSDAKALTEGLDPNGNKRY